MPPTRSGEISGTNVQGDWHPEGDLGAPPRRRPGAGGPRALAACCSLPGTGRPTSLSHWSHAPLADEPKHFPLASSDAASAASVLPAFAHPPPPHLLHPSEVNSSENFPWEQFPLLIMPAAPARLLLSGSLQQGRRLTLAWNSRGDGGGGPTPGITIRAGRPFGMPAQATRSPFHIGVIKMIFHAGPYLLSRPNIQMQSSVLNSPRLPPPTRYHLLQRKLNLLI